MSNELLRIHDENNNCDLVAVANPMGNFHMSTYAEMQDGTQKPVDGWYLFSKMIEKLGQGGGEQPESNVMVVSFTTNSDFTITASHTPNQVKTAMLAGTPVVGVWTDNAEGSGGVTPLGSVSWNQFVDTVGQHYDAGPMFVIYELRPEEEEGYIPHPSATFVKNWNQDKWELVWWFE